MDVIGAIHQLYVVMEFPMYRFSVVLAVMVWAGNHSLESDPVATTGCAYRGGGGGMKRGGVNYGGAVGFPCDSGFFDLTHVCAERLPQRPFSSPHATLGF